MTPGARAGKHVSFWAEEGPQGDEPVPPDEKWGSDDPPSRLKPGAGIFLSREATRRRRRRPAPRAFINTLFVDETAPGGEAGAPPARMRSLEAISLSADPPAAAAPAATVGAKIPADWHSSGARRRINFTAC